MKKLLPQLQRNQRFFFFSIAFIMVFFLGSPYHNAEANGFGKPSPVLIPTITGADTVCENSWGNVYTTESGMTGYSWTLSSGGIITLGAGTNSITVTWTTIGNHTVSVIYNTATQPGTKDVTVKPVLTVGVSIAASATTVCAGTPVTFTATPTNGGTTPVFQWKVNGINIGTNNPVCTYTPAQGDLVNCQLLSSEMCTNGSAAVSNTITMTVNPILPVGITIMASSNPVCQGTPVVFTAIPVNGGSAPTYEWKVNGVIVGTNNINYTYTPVDGDVVSCKMISNANCTSGNPATSNTIVMTVSGGQPVSVTISPSSNPSCQGEQVVFTALTTNGGSSPAYEWKVNGNPVGTNNPTFTYVPTNGDLVQVKVTSNANCISGSSSLSNIITMQVSASSPVSVSVVASSNPVCQGTMVTLTATPVNGGTNPSYQWMVNGFFVGGNQATYTYTPTNGDVVTCQLFSNLGCASGNPATSAPLIMVVNTNVPVFVLIEASANPVCQGSAITFTATPYNGGTAPNYQWLVNGINAGTNAPTFTYTPSNGDMVSCQLTSNAPCTSVNTATSNLITVSVSPILPVSVSITASMNPVCQGSSVSFTATPTNGGTSPTYQWKVNGLNAGTNSSTYVYAPVNNDVVTCQLTSNAGCSSGNPAISNSISMTVIPSSGMTVSVSIAASANPSCQGQSVTYTATPVNGGATPTYQWIVNGINVGTNSPTYSYNPSNGDHVSCQLNSSFTCAVGNPATSNVITMTVNPMQTVTITITASANPACQGNNVTFTANAVNKGTTPVFQWKVNGNNVGTNQSTYTYQPVNGDIVSCQLTSSVPCPVTNPVTSNSITMAVLQSNPAAISISASPNPSCPALQVTYTATPTNGGSAPQYLWKVNGVNTGANSSVLIIIPNNGDQITCQLTSNAGCVLGGNVVQSNVITMVVGGPFQPSVSIAASTNPYCQGGPVTFTATPTNGGTAPTYQWKVNCNVVGTNSSTYTYNPANGDFVTCRMTSNLSCASPTHATSNGITMHNTNLPATIQIAATTNPVCQGSTATFTSTITNGGTSPIYQWKVNGNNAGSNQPTFSYTPSNNDIVTCQLTSNLSCVTGNPVISNSVTIQTSAAIPASISISTKTNPFCEGTIVHFTALPTNGGGSPLYQWKVNGTNMGTNAATLTYMPLNGDLVSCELTSNASCISGSNPVTSNTLTLSSAATLPAGISISSSANSVCQGTNVTFTANSVNGGETPSYQWKVNGVNAGTNSETYSYVPSNNDLVTCLLNSSLTCATSNPATSNGVTMVINPTVPVSIVIAASQNPTCEGSSVTFTATPTNGGSTPAYQWRVNCQNVGTNSSTYTYVPQDGDVVVCILTSNASCPSSTSVISNNINMVVNPIQNVTIVITPSVNPFCPGSPVTFTTTTTGAGETPTYQWKVNGQNVGTNLPTYTYNPAVNDAVTCVLTSSSTCITGNPATSNEVIMTASSGLVVSISIAASANPICAGTQVGFTATVTNGGATPIYQWKVNGNIVNNNLASYYYYPANGDVVQCFLTTSLNCATPIPAPSNAITMTVYPQLPVSISISASQNPTCVGNTVNYTATATNTGSSPLYRWRVNGINQGLNQPTFSYVPNNADVVTCLLVSNATCATFNPATSNAITMIVNPNSPATVTIAASSNPVCQGTSVLYTATPFNGGTSPTYQWKVNGINVGTNSSTYSYVPANGDVVNCDMLSNSTCTSVINATSNVITMTVSPVQPVSLSITASTNPTCLGSNVNYSAIAVNGGTSPTYQWKVNGVVVGGNTPTYSYVPTNNDLVTCKLTSNATCTSGNPANSNGITMSVSSSLPVGITISTASNPTCQGQNVTVNATSTNGGSSPTYNWLLNGIQVGGNTPTYSYYPSNGDQITCQLTSSFSCATGNPATSNVLSMNVNPNVPVSLSIASSSNPSCAGSPVNFTATPVNGGATPSFQWKVNGSNSGTNSSTFTYVPQNGDIVTCELTSSLTCSLGNPAQSNSITMVIMQPQSAGIVIVPSLNPICVGSQVSFTSTVTNGGSNPIYQWKVNGINMGLNLPSFMYTPVNGDVVTCQLTSNSNCLSTNPVTSTPVTMVVSSDLTVGVTIATTNGSICQGEQVTYTATPTNGGTSPTYQWIVNSINVGTNAATYTYAPTNGDQIKCYLTSNLTCASGNPALSNVITAAVNPNVVAGISILSTSNPACIGSPVTFTATATNGGSAPIYQWKVNGTNVGTNASSYTYIPNDNDQLMCTLTSNASCITGNPVISNSVTQIMGTSFPVSVSIAASANQICQGTPVTFTAMPVNIGATPVYQWKVNGLNVGPNSTVYTYAPNDGDVVTCMLTSSLPCGVGNPATSNPITMVVGTNTPPSVSVGVTPSSTICAGTSVIYSAVPFNGGIPSYQWYKNGLPVGTNSSTYADTPLNGDQVYVVLVSSLSCMGNNTATSNIISMVVNPPLVASVSITVNQNSVCAGTPVTFTATPVNGGVPTYQWFKNSVPVGSNQPTYSYIPVNGDQVQVSMTSNLSCVTGSPATSNSISMVVTTPLTVGVTLGVNQNNICAGATATFTATPLNGGTPTYQWFKNSIPVGSNQPTYSYIPINGDQVYVTMNSSLSCITGNPATSNTITMVVSPMPSPTIVGAATACLGSTGNVYTTESGMLNYQWSVSSGGTITSGWGTQSVTITWSQLGAQSVSVTYSNASGCVPTSPSIHGVVVSPMPAPTITGHDDVCVNSGYYDYVTEPGMVNYQWSISSGGTITAGLGTNQIQVTWSGSGAQYVQVNYSNGSGCTTLTPTTFTVNVDPLPSASGNILGTQEVCAGTHAVSYIVGPIQNAVTYVWSLPIGATLVSGIGSNAILVDFGTNAVSGDITVYGNNLCGNGAPSPAFHVEVHALPTTPVATVFGQLLTSTAVTGNQWFHEGNPIPGATGQTYFATLAGWYWTHVTLNGCQSDTSNHVYVTVVGIEDPSETTHFSLYPVPNDGKFILKYQSTRVKEVSVYILNKLGVEVYHNANIPVKGDLEMNIDLEEISDGVYTVVLTTDKTKEIRRFIKLTTK